jgi:hypothetical protein
VPEGLDNVEFLRMFQIADRGLLIADPSPARVDVTSVPCFPFFSSQQSPISWINPY